MGASKRHKVCSVSGIVAAMRPNRIYQLENLAQAYGAQRNCIRLMMEKAVEKGLVDRVKYNGESCYRLVWSDPETQYKTPPPYRDLRLDTTLEGYDRSLRALYELNKENRK